MEVSANKTQASDLGELYATVDKKITLGDNLKKKLDLFRDIDGAVKIQRKISQELKFLEKVNKYFLHVPILFHFATQFHPFFKLTENQVKKTGQLKLNHVLCSNLVHYECLVHTLYNSQNIRYIDFPIPIADRKSPLRIDIVCDNGSTWIKGILSTYFFKTIKVL